MQIYITKEVDVDKILELAMITVSEAYSGKGIGKKMVQVGAPDGTFFFQMDTIDTVE